MAEANQIIFIEAFLASKKIKLTLFLQALFKALKTTITFWCFVFVTLFNLQGTRSCSPLSRTAYIYYHKLFRLSTPFFIFLCKPEFAKIRSKLLSLEANLLIILRCS